MKFQNKYTLEQRTNIYKKIWFITSTNHKWKTFTSNLGNNLKYNIVNFFCIINLLIIICFYIAKIHLIIYFLHI